MKTWICWALFFCGICEGFAQGLGGGVYLRTNAKCIGSVVYNNQARDGFGVGGEDAFLVNTTVVGNKKIVQDTTRIAPGYIYCADGEIVDTAEYKKRSRTDAIGIVYWIRGDVNAVYPKGAVVALQERGGLRWGNAGVLNIGGQYENEEWASYAYLKDTACYGNTRKMEEQYNKGNSAFEAGHYCYNYTAFGQEPSNPRWCMPVYLHLRRIFSALPAVDASLKFLKRQHPGGKIDVISGKDKLNAWYWSTNDGLAGEKNNAFAVNFITGEIGENGQIEAEKTTGHYVRPIFIY